MRCDKVSAVITNRWNQYLDKFEDYQCDIYYSEEYVQKPNYKADQCTKINYRVKLVFMLAQLSLCGQFLQCSG